MTTKSLSERAKGRRQELLNEVQLIYDLETRIAHLEKELRDATVGYEQEISDLRSRVLHLETSGSV